MKIFCKRCKKKSFAFCKALEKEGTWNKGVECIIECFQCYKGNEMKTN